MVGNHSVFYRVTEIHCSQQTGAAMAFTLWVYRTAFNFVRPFRKAMAAQNDLSTRYLRMLQRACASFALRLSDREIRDGCHSSSLRIAVRMIFHLSFQLDFLEFEDIA
jgi:hypothetical protein